MTHNTNQKHVAYINYRDLIKSVFSYLFMEGQYRMRDLLQIFNKRASIQ